MPRAPTFSTHIGDQAQVGKVINVGQINAETVSFEAEAPRAGEFRLLNPPEPFVDRAAERAALVEKLRRGGPHLLCGLGGVGKTALALRAAHDLAAEGVFPDGVLWVPLESGPPPEMAAAWLVTAFGVTGEARPLSALAGLLRARRALLVLDNAEAAVDAADAILERRGRAAILVTSRDVCVGATIIPHDALDDLAPLEPGDAADLLRAQLGDVPMADRQAAEVCALTGCLPLALVLAAAFMARELRGSPDPAAEYLELLRTTPLVALEMGRRRDTSVRVTFDLSWQRLDDAASRALAALACAPADSVDGAAVAAGLDADEPAARAALRTLTRLSLAEREADRYRVHPLVRHYARRRTGDETAATVRRRLRRHYLGYAQEYEVGAEHPYCGPLDVERDNVLGAMAWAWEEEDWPQVIAFANATKYYLQLRGYPYLARERGGWWLTAARRLEHQREEANAISSLGDVHRMLAEYGAARERYEAALPLYREIGARLGEANAIASLGDVHRMLAEYGAARERYEAALPLYREIGDRLGEANALRSLGDVALAEDRYDDVEAFYHQALAINRAVGDRYGVAHTTAMLGRLAAARGRGDEARRLLEEAVRAFEEMGAKGAASTVRRWLEAL